MKNKAFFATLALCLGLAVPRAHAEKIALLVGIDHYPDPAHRLDGCLKDVDNVRRLLVEQFGYKAGNITVLADTDATRRGIEETFRQQLIERAKPGDEVFFYFSGHGSVAPDFESPTAHALEEGVLCPYDANEDQPAATVLPEHRLRALLAAVPTDRVIVVLDACHSGGITLRSGQMPRVLKAKYMRLGFDPADYNDAPATARRRGVGEPVGGNPKHLILAACTDQQSAYIAEPSGSVFTEAFVRAARDLDRKTATYGDLVARLTPEVDRILHEYGEKRPQTPQAKGTMTQSLFSPDPAVSKDPSAKTVTPFTTPAVYADFSLTLWTEKTTYRDGNTIRVNVQADRDCFLRLYHRDVNGEIQLIFPNRFQQDNHLKAHERVTVPGPAANFEFIAQAPFGSEVVKAVASTRQFTDLERVDWKDTFIDYGAAANGLGETRTRGIGVVEKRSDSPRGTDFSETEIVIHVLP